MITAKEMAPALDNPEDRPERPPIEILAGLMDKFDKVHESDRVLGEPEWRDWYGAVRGCLEILRQDGLIPEGAIQDTDGFLEASLLPGFGQEMGKRRKQTYELIGKVLGRNLIEN